jgi:hypothetical protein
MHKNQAAIFKGNGRWLLLITFFSGITAKT